MTSSLQPQPFPYKREFINPDQLWQNALQQDAASIEIVQPQKGWRTIPRQIQWNFKGASVGCVVSSDAYDAVNRLVDYFSEEARMQAKRKGKSSPYDYYMQNYAQIYEKAQELAQADATNMPFRHWLREAVYLMIPECTAFKISVTKAIFKYFGSKVVLDPSGGWGDRLLGAAAANVPIYHAIEPNPNLVQPYQEMIEFVTERNSNLKYAVIHEDFLKVKLSPASYDTVFTSPPFFDYEEYVNDPKQSIHGEPTLQDWTEHFLYPYLSKAWYALAPGGYFILYMSDTRDKYSYNMYTYINNKLKGKYLGVIAVTPEHQKYAYPLWVWQK